MKHIQQLKVNVKSLAAEQIIIRNETNKIRKRILADRASGRHLDTNLVAIRNDLTDHRRYVVRPHARIANLAYAFLRGKKYSAVETKTNTPIDHHDLITLVDKINRFSAMPVTWEIVQVWLAPSD